MLKSAFALATCITAVLAQTTYTGCHNHTSGNEVLLYCFGPNGQETARETYAVSAPLTTPAPNSATATAASGAGQTTAVTACHGHGSAVYCINGAGVEVLVKATPTGAIPAAYTGCHAHGSSQYCLDPSGGEVAVVSEEASSGGASSSEEEGAGCHEHGGVLHCPGGAGEVDCGLRDREFNVGFRVGSLFIILVTSMLGVFAPLLLKKLPFGSASNWVLMILKQFGTGIIISTAFIHLYTHADLMFANPCLGEMSYEGTTAAVVMAGIFLCFLIEYIGMRIVAARTAKDDTHSAENVAVSGKEVSLEGSQNGFAMLDHHHGGGNNKLSVTVMEAGILFHSILIGLTLVVSSDRFFRTLLIVIVFHQFFEGLALGARIALLPGKVFPSKFLMCIAFTLITPIGMAIGLGVLYTFNGNNPSTVLTFGVLDAISAGILIWVGLVDMWARDWVIEGGELVSSNVIKTLVAGTSLVLGVILMSILGKWA